MLIQDRTEGPQPMVWALLPLCPSLATLSGPELWLLGMGSVMSLDEVRGREEP